MKVVVLSGSRIGSKTRIAMNYTVSSIHKKYPDSDVTLLDLALFNVQFSDGRNYMEYEGDTKFVIQMIMEADVIVIGTPIFKPPFQQHSRILLIWHLKKHSKGRL